MDGLTGYGFWELGRFSVVYRSLFGEMPAATLRRPLDETDLSQIPASPWELAKSA